jgi:hypothetical protein
MQVAAQDVDAMTHRDMTPSRRDRATWIRQPHDWTIARKVCEEPAKYDAYQSEGSEYRSLGFMPVAGDADWTATLTVPIPSRDIAFIELARRGELPPGYRGAEESASLSLPIGEIDALIELLTGVIAQARRDGVLLTQ